MSKLTDKKRRQLARKQRIRRSIQGKADCPRISVYFSNKNIIAQAIDDNAGKTVASVSTIGSGISASGKTRATAKDVAATLADKVKSAGVEKAVFDRNGRRYHGKVKDFADAMREKGIQM